MAVLQLDARIEAADEVPEVQRAGGAVAGEQPRLGGLRAPSCPYRLYQFRRYDPIVAAEPGEDESLARMLRAGRLDDGLERDRAFAATEAALFGVDAPVKFGRYVMLERIGAGGQGIVHAAYDPELDRRVAIKLLGTRTSASKHADLLREAQAAARLSHPNVLAVHDVGTFERPPSIDKDAPPSGVYVVTELVDGETLQAWLAGRSRRRREVLDVLVAAGRGIAAAHASGLVHADVKPANVLIGQRRSRSRPRLRARARVRLAERARFRRCAPSWPARLRTWPPEQHSGSSELDPRADIYRSA